MVVVLEAANAEQARCDLAFQSKLDARKVGDQAGVAFVEAKANVACLAHPVEWHMMRLRPRLPTGIALTRRTRLPRVPRVPPRCHFRAPGCPLRSRQASAFLLERLVAGKEPWARRWPTARRSRAALLRLWRGILRRQPRNTLRVDAGYPRHSSPLLICP